jgi:hypothetical protein
LVAQVVNDRGGTVVPAYSHSGAAAAFSHRPRLQVQDP